MSYWAYLSTVDIVKRTISAILNLVYPKNCFSCGKNGAYFCRSCLKNLELVLPPRQSLQGLCSGGLDGLIAIGSSKNKSLFKAIKFLKYNGIKEVAFDLSGILAERIKSEIPDWKSGIIFSPIPLHPARERSRGFNQAELLAEATAEKLGVALKTGLLKKIKDTPPQARTSSRKQRFENIRGSFEVAPDPVLKEARIVLIDDVLTTGATMSEAASALKKAGAKIVIGAVAARG